MKTPQHWVEQYIGIPYTKGGNDLEGFDCWGMVRYIQREHFNLDLPIIDVDSSNMRAVMKQFKNDPELDHWEQVKKPVEGTAVLLSQSSNPSHVGIWLEIDSGKLMHCVKGMGVILSSMRNLESTGWTNIRYYNHIPGKKRIKE